ncbi:integrase catalytic domain-containing protein [Trichonephila clavipes]|nr:integrase catalytic domain-containing protein [Trichonephila clavipes]
MLDSKWWEGPRWLKNNREQWPANEINCEPKDVILEKRKSELVNVNISEELVPWVHVEEREISELSSDDIENAERVLIRLVQDKLFPNLKSIPIVNVFRDNEEIIRVKTKITERKDDPNFIAPILMPSIDLAGPLFTRDGGKVWIVLLHLCHLSSDTSRANNGTNFVGTNSELKNLDWDKIMKETDIKPIKWKFNPPTAAWWGGWWERLVRVIKELLKRTLDPNDLIPLTPSLFLNGKSSYDTVDLDLSEFSKFQKRIKYRRKLIHDFRSRFRKEYLGQLRQKRPGKPGHDFKVGDVVMIEEPSKKRVYWPLGKVMSLLPGRDGKVRTLKLKCKNSELIRPIQRVYPLEVPFINNEIVKIDGVPTSSVNEDKLTSNAVIKNKVTRSGRLVKIPERLGLFNEVLYAFE